MNFLKMDTGCFDHDKNVGIAGLLYENTPALRAELNQDNVYYSE